MSFLSAEDNEWQSFKRLAWVVLVFLLILAIVGRIYRPLLVSLVMSGIVAYIFDPVIGRLTQLVSLRRKVLVGVLISLVVFSFVVLSFLVIPVIYEELINIVSHIPDALAYIEKAALPLLTWLKKTKIYPEEVIEAGYRKLARLDGWSFPQAGLAELFSQSSIIIDLLFNLLMFPLFTYVLLGEREKLEQALKKWIPEDVSPLISVFASRVDTVLRAVVKGQFLVAFVLSVFYMLGFALIELPSGLVIGAVAGICRVVPYLDVLVALCLSSIIILSQGAGGAMFVAVLGVVAVVQSLDGVIVTPRIIGDRAGLHPIVVIASVYCFGTWLGLLGVLLAVPIIAASVVAAQTCWPYVMHSPFFRSPYRAQESHQDQPPPQQ